MRSRADEQRDFEAFLLTGLGVLFAAAFALGWVASYWVHRG